MSSQPNEAWGIKTHLLFLNQGPFWSLVLWEEWTHRPEICSDVLSRTCPNLVLLAVHGFQSQSCLSNLQIALQHISGWMSKGHLCLRLQQDLMNRKISGLKHMMTFRILSGVNVNWMLKTSCCKKKKKKKRGMDKLISIKTCFLTRYIFPLPVSVLPI